jgi:hypothetical protein
VKTDCKNLILGVTYCVQAVGNIAGYPNYTTSQYFTLPPLTYSTTSVAIITDYPTPTFNSTVLLPTASGTASDCSLYRNYVPIPAVIDQSQGTDETTLNPYINNCAFYTASYDISMEEFLKWNPSLPPTECSLQPGFSYCIYKGSLPTGKTAQRHAASLKIESNSCQRLYIRLHVLM